MDSWLHHHAHSLTYHSALCVSLLILCIPHPAGFGWAFLRTAYDAFGGMPDYSIVGDGDWHFAFALVGQDDLVRRRDITPELQRCRRDKSTLIVSTLQHIVTAHGYERALSYARVNISHEWHGSLSGRRYVQRDTILTNSNFNPDTDLDVYAHRSTPCPGAVSDMGLAVPELVLNSTRVQKLHDVMMVYFWQRNEEQSSVDEDLATGLAHGVSSAEATNAANRLRAGKSANKRPTLPPWVKEDPFAPPPGAESRGGPRPHFGPKGRG
jgi:hypothetical protein